MSETNALGVCSSRNDVAVPWVSFLLSPGFLEEQIKFFIKGVLQTSLGVFLPCLEGSRSPRSPESAGTL